MSKEISGIVAWLKNWFYDKTEVNGFVTTLNNSINSKLNKNLTEANKQLVTDGSGQVVLASKPVVPTNTSDLVNDGETGVDTYVESGDLSTVATSGSYNDLSNKPTIPDVSNLIDTAGTGLSKSGTTLNHSNSVTAQTSAVFKKIKYDAEGHITGTANVGSSDLPTHEQSATSIIDGNAHSNIGTSANARQGVINTAIDTAIGNLQSIKAIEVVTTLPTASSSTMGKLYIISENSKINVYYTITDGQLFEWHKMDADILDELSISWNDITGKPSTFTPASHTHGNITNEGKVGTNTYANKILVTGSGGVVTIASTISTLSILEAVAHTNIGTRASTTQAEINNAIDTVIGGLKTDKQDEITSIVLIPKTDDASGRIVFYTGDEPSP